MAVVVLLPGMQGRKISSVTPKPLASGAVDCRKSIVAVITPVTVASAVAAAVALARMENRRYTLWSSRLESA